MMLKILAEYFYDKNTFADGEILKNSLSKKTGSTSGFALDRHHVTLMVSFYKHSTKTDIRQSHQEFSTIVDIDLIWTQVFFFVDFQLDFLAWKSGLKIWNFLMAFSSKIFAISHCLCVKSLESISWLLKTDLKLINNEIKSWRIQIEIWILGKMIVEILWPGQGWLGENERLNVHLYFGS